MVTVDLKTGMPEPESADAGCRAQEQLYFLRFSYVFCYGFPVMISLWLLLTDRLGYSPYDSSGWCSSPPDTFGINFP